jgi:hypothetical protein
MAGEYTPLLLICEPLGQDQTEFDGDIRHVGARQAWLKLGGEQNGVHWRGKQEEQDALDEGDKGPVEHVEGKLWHLFANNLPVTGISVC